VVNRRKQTTTCRWHHYLCLREHTVLNAAGVPGRSYDADVAQRMTCRDRPVPTIPVIYTDYHATRQFPTLTCRAPSADACISPLRRLPLCISCAAHSRINPILPTPPHSILCHPLQHAIIFPLPLLPLPITTLHCILTHWCMQPFRGRTREVWCACHSWHLNCCQTDITCHGPPFAHCG